jgi:hypothetical protein
MKPYKIDDYYAWNTDQNEIPQIQAQDQAIFGRKAYWQDPAFYHEQFEEAQNRMMKRFPITLLKQLKSEIKIIPICASYVTFNDDIHVIPYDAMTERLTSAPTPKHVNNSPIRDVDAEYTLTFIVDIDIRPAKDLQLKASEDELVTRLKDITIDSPHTSLMNMGKLILAYAAFQSRQQDKAFDKNWRLGDKVQSIEDLADLRTQLDLKKDKSDTKQETDFDPTKNIHTSRDTYHRVVGNPYAGGLYKPYTWYPTYPRPHQRSQFDHSIRNRYQRIQNRYRSPSPPSYKEDEEDRWSHPSTLSTYKPWMRTSLPTYRPDYSERRKLAPLKLKRDQQAYGSNNKYDDWRIVSQKERRKREINRQKNNMTTPTTKEKDDKKEEKEDKTKPRPRPRGNRNQDNKRKRE